MKALRHLVMPVRVLPHHGIGGMQAVAWDLATAFVERGVRVTVLTAAIAGRPESFEDTGVQVRALHGTSWRRYGRRWWQATRKAFEQELLGSCDLVLSVSAGGFGLLPLRPRAPRVPFVLQAHGTSVGEVISKWRAGSFEAIASSLRNLAWIAKDLEAYRKFDAIVAVGDRVAADLTGWPIGCFLQHRRVKLIRNGIDAKLFKPDVDARMRVREELGWGEDLKVIVSVSRLHKQKGLDLGLDAFAVLARQDQGVRYLIVGEGPELEALNGRAAVLGIDGHVQFTGGVIRERIPAYLSAADAMLFTTTHMEGNPLNVLEALSVGLPVVTSSHLFRNAPCGERILPVDQNDPAAVAAALQRALLLGPCPHGGLPPGFSMTESVEAYLNLFEDLILHRGSSMPPHRVISHK